MNPGFDKKEIEKLKQECKDENQNYVLVLDELELSDTGEYVQLQFVGKKDGQEVIYDAALFTLELHYTGMLLEEAENRVANIHKGFVRIEDRDETYKADVDIDQMVEEFILEMEEDESLKVGEFMTEDTDFEFGIGLEVALNVPDITPAVIEKFVKDFNAGTLKLDSNRYSFKQDLTRD